VTSCDVIHCMVLSIRGEAGGRGAFYQVIIIVYHIVLLSVDLQETMMKKM